MIAKDIERKLIDCELGPDVLVTPLMSRKDTKCEVVDCDFGVLGAGCDWSPACLAHLAGGAAAGSKEPPSSDGVPLNTLLDLKEDCMVSCQSLTHLRNCKNTFYLSPGVFEYRFPV